MLKNFKEEEINKQKKKSGKKEEKKAFPYIHLCFIE